MHSAWGLVFCRWNKAGLLGQQLLDICARPSGDKRQVVRLVLPPFHPPLPPVLVIVPGCWRYHAGCLAQGLEGMGIPNKRHVQHYLQALARHMVVLLPGLLALLIVAAS